MSKKKKKKNKKKKAIGTSLAAKLEYKKLKKISAKQGSNIFICEAHAHGQSACGTRFRSFGGSVECPNCGNQYCRWENYESPSIPFSKETEKNE